ncbi:hypothetical protein DW094_00155 [Ruminococcaceae bacterium AM07-15]|nr:hypothetical protein DW094_00155 [Ruminococcaceae bacterium AM07-15]
MAPTEWALWPTRVVPRDCTEFRLLRFCRRRFFIGLPRLPVFIERGEGKMDLIKKTRDENWEEEDWCKDRWMLQGYVVNSGSHISATANVSLCYNGDGMETVAFGIGPIEAAFHAIENIVQTGAQLVSYSIRSMSRGMDAQGQVEVQLEHGGNTITGVGLSTDIIEASIKAYLDGVNQILAK